MVGGLSRTEADHYHQQGYVVPTFRLSEPEVLQLRESVDRLISENPDTRPEHLVNAHIAHPNAEGVKGAEAILELAKHPGILDQVQSVIGEDIILWGCQLFCNQRRMAWRYHGIRTASTGRFSHLQPARCG